MHTHINRLFAVTFLIMFSFAALTACGELFEEEGPEGTSSRSDHSHKSGQNCIGCHDDVEYAGTIYSDASGSSTVSGETIVVTQNDGTVISMVSDRDGNFWSNSGNAGVGYRVAVVGNSVDMISQTSNGACNAGGCHNGSSVARVYVN